MGKVTDCAYTVQSTMALENMKVWDLDTASLSVHVGMYLAAMVSCISMAMPDFGADSCKHLAS